MVRWAGRDSRLQLGLQAMGSPLQSWAVPRGGGRGVPLWERASVGLSRGAWRPGRRGSPYAVWGSKEGLPLLARPPCPPASVGAKQGYKRGYPSSFPSCPNGAGCFQVRPGLSPGGRMQSLLRPSGSGFQTSEGPCHPQEGRLCPGRGPTEPSRREPAQPALRTRVPSWLPGARASCGPHRNDVQSVPGWTSS